MKLTLFFLLAALMHVSASVYSQQTKLSVSMRDATVKEVLKQIEEQSKFFFLYKSIDIDVNRIVSVDIKEKSVEILLDQIFNGTTIAYEIVNRQIVLTDKAKEISLPEAQQQKKTISGKVTDASGATLPGVSVVVKGTTNGAITDNEGKFSLANVPENATLQFSFIGMITQNIVMGSKTIFNIVMQEETIGVEEVVVVGYGTQKKVNLTGAVSSVKIDNKISSRTLSNVSTGLTGMVPGLSVSQNSGMAGKNDVTILIRGLGTVNNARPLVVVDGMPDVDINRLNMNDIESISVLKDATSSAVYGSRAANGVILITTKSGKGMAKTKITINSNFAIEQPTRAYEFMADYPRALTLHQRIASVNTLRSNLRFKDGTVDQWMALGMIDPLRFPNTDWWDIILRTGQIQNHNLSASGSNEKSNFFISIGLMDEKGLQINNDYSRYNARFNYDYKVRHNMNVGIRFAGNWSEYVYTSADGFTTNSSGTGFAIQTAIAGITPYDPVTGFYGGVMAYNEDAQAYNPLTIYRNTGNTQAQKESNASIYYDWTPLKGLVARIDYALNYYSKFRYSANIPNKAYNFQTDTYGSRVYVGENAGIDNVTNEGYKTQLTGRLTYKTTIKKNHDLSAMLVYSEEYWHDRSQTSSRTDRLHPSLHEIDAALAGTTQEAGGNSSNEGLQSYIGRLNYAAFNRYLFEINCRYDGSSKFYTGSQYGFFPSAALGWRFTEENFLKPYLDKILSNGKFRVSYGGLGNNSGVGRYEQQETLNASHYIFANSIAKGLVNRKMINRGLSWENSTVFNLGLDLGFLDNRLTTEFDYYDRLTSGMNQPSDMSIHLTGAYNAPRINIGNLRNRGIEGNITWKDKIGGVNYNLNLNGSYNATVLEKWSGYLGRGNTFLDMPYQFLYTYEDTGIAQTWEDVYNATPQGAQPGDLLRKDLNGDGRIDGNDRKADPKIQRNRPTTNFAFSSGLAWKGFDLNILFQGAAGRKEYWINNFNQLNFGEGRYASSWDHWNNPWTVENRDGAWPRLGGNNNNAETTFWLDDLSYLRLKNVQIGYELPKKWLLKLGISNVRIYGSGENLVTFTKYRGLDPEKVGHVSDAYPLNKTFSLGINIEI